MDIHYKDLSNVTGIGKDVVRQLMCRKDFSHIPIRKGIYYGVSFEDIKKLQEIYENRKWGRRKKCFSNIAEDVKS